MHFKDACTKQCTLSVIGILLIAFGTAFAIFWIDLFHKMMAKEMQLGPNSKTYDGWKSPPMPITFEVYLYNWTNPINFTDDEPYRKPILKSIGPYRFIEKMDKDDIRWNSHNSTVSYTKRSTFYFDAAGSNGSLDDTITTLNVIALSAAAKADNMSYVNQKQVSLGLNLYNHAVYVTKTAGEFLFEGYQDDLIDMAIEMKSFAGEEFEVPADRFGWFYGRNGTSNSGTYNVHTGEKDITQFGSVQKWNYKSTIDYYNDECSQINGSAGEFYPPKQTKDTPVTIFTPDLCRPLTFDYERESDVLGIHGYKYTAGEKTVDNGTKYPEMKCYNIANKKRAPSGVFDISDCRYGTPIFMSFPHYYAADPYYRQFYECEGEGGGGGGDSAPNKDDHEFYVILEPMTGIVLEVAARLQINLRVKPVPNIGIYQNAPFMYFPALWFNQKVTITEEMASEIRMVQSIPTIGYICIGVLIVIGLILLSWLPVQRYVQKRFQKNFSKSAAAADAGGDISKKQNDSNHYNGKPAHLQQNLAMNEKKKSVLMVLEDDRKNGCNNCKKENGQKIKLDNDGVDDDVLEKSPLMDSKLQQKKIVFIKNNKEYHDEDTVKLPPLAEPEVFCDKIGGSWNVEP